MKFYNDILFKSIAERHLSWAVTLLFIGGLFVRRASRRGWCAEWWMLAVLVYFLVVNKENRMHEYYQLPFIPSAAIVIARMLEALRAPLPRLQHNARQFLATMSIVMIAAQLLLSGMRYNALLAGERDTTIIEFTAMALSLIPDDAKVLTVGDGNPLLLYLLHRKGRIVNSGTLAGVDQRPPCLVLPPAADSYAISEAMKDLITGAVVLHEHGGYRLLER